VVEDCQRIDVSREAVLPDDSDELGGVQDEQIWPVRRQVHELRSTSGSAVWLRTHDLSFI